VIAFAAGHPKVTFSTACACAVEMDKAAAQSAPAALHNVAQTAARAAIGFFVVFILSPRF
jgi:hypothetical protein